MRIFLETILFILVFVKKVYTNLDNYVEQTAVNLAGTSTRNYVFWPNATVPFYINPDHFDPEQTTSIMTTLALFAFKSCIKFLPVLAPPLMHQHVLVIANPEGIRHCAPTAGGHPLDEPHTLILGYDCLRPPHIDMMLMKALGFPFEHNRASRDVFISVQFENIDPSAMELFTKDDVLPLELRSLSYDVDSVMHFGERDYSKNGHRTIIFKDRSKQPVKQNRVGLTPLDLRKIEIVYGTECRKRDRQEKIELCRNYPAVARRKREVNEEVTSNLRVNRDITPAPNDLTEHVNNSLRELGIENEVQDVVDQVYKVSSKALANARAKYCNGTKPDLRVAEERVKNTSKPDILGVIETIADYAKSMVDHALLNITEFCMSSGNFESYQRSCKFFANRPCPVVYKSTKSGPVMHSTQHRPLIYQSTKNRGSRNKSQYVMRVGNHTEEVTDGPRRRRHADANGTADDKAGEDELRTVGSQKNEDEATVTEALETTGNTKASLRSATDVPHHRQNRRHAEPKKRARSYRAKKERYDADESVQNKREKRVRQRQKPRVAKEKKTRDVPNRHKTRLRNKPDPEESSNPGPMTVHLSKENVEFYNERKWPEGVVRYILTEDPNYDMADVRSRLAEVNSILEKKTCVRIEEITEDEAGEYEDYLVVDTGADFVTGRVGGKQNFGTLELYQGGQHQQHAAMMVMAMLGFYFELARHDRDKYVRVHLRHVRPDKLHHFEKIRSDATFPLPYDYESATHPAWQFWRKVGIKGISTVATFKSKDPDGDIMRSLGQNENLLSEMDIVKINTVYGVKCFQNSRSRKTGKQKQNSKRQHHKN